MEILKQLIGRLHPLVVHLPIGFILLGLLLKYYDRKKLEHQNVIPLIFFWGGISAFIACITGYLQYLGEGYAFETVKWHLWSGIATTLFSFLMYAKLKKIKAVDFLSKTPAAVLPILFLILISFTGHEGGNITHGEAYLVEPLPNSMKSALGFETFEQREIVLNEDNWEASLLYEDIVKPILNNKCVSCHNPKKTKGELLLHDKEGILKGGANGDVVLAKNSSKSELFIRMNLPMEDDQHMPPDGKTQPTKEEISLVGAWIDVGHPFEGSIKESGLKKELFASFFPKKIDNDYPNKEVIEASMDSIRSIENHGIHIDQINIATNFLSVSAINKPSFSDEDMILLKPIAEQISILDLGGTKVTNEIFKQLITLPNLTILKLDNTTISGEHVELISSMPHLKTLNLTNTSFEEKHLQKFAKFKNLKKVFLYQSNIESKGILKMKDGQISIDFGNYELAPIASDSIIY